MIHSSSGCSLGVLLYRRDDFVDGLAGAHRRADGLQPAVERMGVPVAERRHQKAAVEVDLVGARRRRRGLIAQRPHHSVGDEQRIGLRRARSRSRRR